MSYRIRYILLEAVLIKVNRFARQYKTVVALVNPRHGRLCSIPINNKEPRIYQIRLYHKAADRKNECNVIAHQN